jgi:hypothetical protein
MVADLKGGTGSLAEAMAAQAAKLLAQESPAEKFRITLITKYYTLRQTDAD